MAKTFFDFNKKIFTIQNENDFEQVALEVFRYQYHYNSVYQKYCNYLKTDVLKINTIEKIPFLPISFFKTHEVKTEKFSPEVTYKSSGTSGMQNSQHDVRFLSLYKESFTKAFRQFYGLPNDYIILGLLPSYLEREGSSLIYMVQSLIEDSNHPKSGFYLHNLNDLAVFLVNHKTNKKILLIGGVLCFIGSC